MKMRNGSWGVVLGAFPYRSLDGAPKATLNCSACHMPLARSNDFGAKRFDESGELKVHDHDGALGARAGLAVAGDLQDLRAAGTTGNVLRFPMKKFP